MSEMEPCHNCGKTSTRFWVCGAHVPGTDPAMFLRDVSALCPDKECEESRVRLVVERAKEASRAQVSEGETED